MVEHRHVRLDGGQGLGRSAGCARDGGGEPAGLGLVVDEVDRIRRHPARGGATVAGAGGGHGDAGRGVGGGNLQPARVVIAFGAPVVGDRLPDLGGGGIGQRHPRVRELLPAARARWRSRGGAVVLVHGGRDAGWDRCGDDEDDRAGAPQQAHPGPGPPGALRIGLGVAHGGSTSVVVVVVVAAAPARAGASGSEPRKASTTAGDSRTARGGPPAITAPRSMATRRSASSAMKAMSCSTTSRVASSRSRTLCNRPTMASTSRWATPEAGSSRRTTEGWWATTAARSTRRREPVDSSLTRLSAYRSRPKGASSSSTRL